MQANGVWVKHEKSIHEEHTFTTYRRNLTASSHAAGWGGVTKAVTGDVRWDSLISHRLCRPLCFPGEPSVTSAPCPRVFSSPASRTASPSADPAASSGSSGSLSGRGCYCKREQNTTRLRFCDWKRRCILRNLQEGQEFCLLPRFQSACAAICCAIIWRTDQIPILTLNTVSAQQTLLTLCYVQSLHNHCQIIKLE